MVNRDMSTNPNGKLSVIYWLVYESIDSIACTSLIPRRAIVAIITAKIASVILFNIDSFIEEIGDGNE